MFVLNPRLAADLFDGEYIIANLDTGLYYSVQGIAVSLLRSLPFEDEVHIIQRFSSAIPQHDDTIQGELTSIFQQLVQEDIIQNVEMPNVVARDQIFMPSAYEISRFNRYADMQDLLMLDPIHDVDEEGWVAKKDQ